MHGISVQLAHKFNVKTALDHCDIYLAKRAAEDEDFLQMGTVCPFHVTRAFCSTELQSIGFGLTLRITLSKHQIGIALQTAKEPL